MRPLRRPAKAPIAAEPPAEASAHVRIEHDPRTIEVVARGKVLLSIDRSSDQTVEDLADVLAAHGLTDQAREVRRLLYGR